MIVVSYYTDEKYERYARDLGTSLRRLGVRYDIEKVADLGSWKKNTHHKALFLRRKLDEHSGEEAIVWIDADAVAVSPLSLFENPSFEVAIYRWREGSLTPLSSWHNSGRLMSGTIYFRNGDFSRMVLDAWILENGSHPERMDQKNLATVLSKVDPRKLSCLPAEYCWIERYMREFSHMAKPVVVHAASFLKGAPEKLSLSEPPEILVESYHGLGDAFYMRPAIKKFSREHPGFYLSNPWPTIFGDADVKLVKPDDVTLRVQKENASRPFGWTKKPENFVRKFLAYDTEDFKKGKTPIEAFMGRLGMVGAPLEEDFRFSVPEEWTAKWRKKLPDSFGILHLPTLRREWKNNSRLPEEGYVSRLASLDMGGKWVSLEPSKSSEEWIVDPPLKNTVHIFRDDEISVEDLIAIVSLAKVVLTNVCFLLPMAPAVGTPVFVVFGGSVGPELLFHQCMGDRFGWVAPEPFCNCFRMDHDCNKTIQRERLEGTWKAFLEKIRSF